MYYSFAFKTKMSSHVVSCLLCIILYIVNNALPLDTCAGVCVCVLLCAEMIVLVRAELTSSLHW